MKVKKAVKRLDKVVAVLSDIIKKYTPSDNQLRSVLSDARASVVRALGAVNSSASPRTATKERAKATTKKRVAAAPRRERSVPAKTRRAAAKSRTPTSMAVHARKRAAVNTSDSVGTAAAASGG